MRFTGRPFALQGVLHRTSYNSWNYCHSAIWWTFTTLILILGESSGIYAQTPHQDLYDQLDQMTSDSDKFQIILNYENQRTLIVNEKYADLLETTIDYLNQSGEPTIAMPLANTLLEFYLFGDHVDHVRVVEILNKMQGFLSDLPFDSVLEQYYIYSGEANIYTNHPIEAIDNFKFIIKESKKSGDTIGPNYAYAHLKLAEIYSNQWNILESDAYFRAAGDLFQGRKDTTMYLWALSGKSTLYSINGLYYESDGVRKKIFSTGKSSGDLHIVTIAHLSAALEYKDRKMADLQYHHLKKSRQYVDFPSDVQDYVKTITYALMTQYFSIQEMVDSTDYYFEKFSEFYIPEKHGPWVHEYYQIASAYNAKVHRQYAKAEFIAKELINESGSQSKLNSLSRIYEFLVEIYKSADQKSKAFDALSSLTKLRDSLSNIQINNQFLYYNQLFESEKKDKQILQQESSIQLLSARNKLLFWRGLWILFTISGLFLILYLFRSYKFTRHKSRLQEVFSQELIREQEKERLRISQDLHDGIGQDLILIKNTLDINDQTDIADMVTGSLTQLREVSRSLYPVTLSNYGLKAGLEALLHKIDCSQKELEVLSHIEEGSGNFTSEAELHIFRIAQEALTNVLKYARCDKVNVEFRKVQDCYILRVSDDGLGMDMDHASFRKGVGMNSMEERSRILGGTLFIDSEKNRGTSITLKIPDHE